MWMYSIAFFRLNRDRALDEDMKNFEIVDVMTGYNQFVLHFT